MQILNAHPLRGRHDGHGAAGRRSGSSSTPSTATAGVWIAKKLRALWKAGCDVSIIYSVSSRPVLSILRNPAGRGPIPMRQSVVKDYWGNIVKYNHSKWMTIIGRWGNSHGTYQTFSGSANWANLAFGDDEQMQRISSRSVRPAPQRGLQEDVAAAQTSKRAGYAPGGRVRSGRRRGAGRPAGRARGRARPSAPASSAT